MGSQAIEAHREGAEVYRGAALCAEKSVELLAETNMPLGLLPLAEMEEVGYNRATGFVWLRQKKAITHTFKQIGRQVSYGAEVTAFVEDRRMKRMTGVKTKELLIWVTLSDMFIEKDDHSKITFKTPTGLSRTYPVSAFGKEGDAAANGKAKAPAPAAVAPAASVPRGQVDLVDFIDWSGVECLNQDASHNIANALKQGYRDDEGLYLASDSDEQLLIHIPFMQVVKLHSALFKGPEEEGPKTVKLFSNKEHMGFSNVNDYPPSDSLDLSADHLVESKPVMLKYVKFQNVRSLTIFVEDNQSESDASKIQKIVLYGTTVDTTNMKDLKKIEEH